MHLYQAMFPLKKDDGEGDDAGAENGWCAQSLVQEQDAQHDGYDWLEVAEDGAARGGDGRQGGVVDETRWGQQTTTIRRATLRGWQACHHTRRIRIGE